MATPTSTDVRSLYVDAVRALHHFVARPAVAERWDEPSALDGMTIGALCAHVLRAAGATPAYLDRTPSDRRPDGDPLTAIAYFTIVLDEPIHERIKEVSSEEATIGHEATVAKLAELADTLPTRLAQEPTDRLIGGLSGRLLTLDDYCATRIFEVVAHLDDLAASLGEPSPETDPAAMTVIIDLLVGIARAQSGDWAVVHALSRAERTDPTVFPVL